MPKIDQELLKRLKKTLGVGQAAVYDRIKKTSRQHRMPRRDLAALMLAWENEISIQKFATPEQIEKLGGLTGGNDTPARVAVLASARAPARRAKPDKAKKTVGNSVFVVHGRDVHEHLHRMFADDGWDIVFNYEPESLHETEFGSFTTNDGILSVCNPAI